jgi:hypothetical protein
MGSSTKSMSASQIARFTKAMEDQGVGVTRTKKGLFLRLPNGESDMVHFSNSDVRSFDNLVARLRRAGVQHPDDPKVLKDLPKYITEGTVKEASKDRIYSYVRDHGYPTEVFQGEVSTEIKLEPSQTNRSLYHAGFVPSLAKDRRRRTRAWLTPAWLLEEKPEEEPVAEPAPTPHTDAALMDFADRARKAQEAVNALGAGPKPMDLTEEESEAFVEGMQSQGRMLPPDVDRFGQTEEEQERDRPLDVSRETSGREFIDTHDSWTLDLSNKPAHLTLSDYLTILESAGLGYEIRVWRIR